MYLTNFAALFLIILFYSCEEKIVPSYENKHDPNSENYYPNRPDSLQAKSVLTSGVELNWLDRSLGEIGFLVERSYQVQYYFNPIDTVAENTTEYTDTTLIKENEDYYYRVRALGKNNSSDYSNLIKVNLTVLPMSNFSFSSIDENRIILNWENNSDVPRGFRIYSNKELIDSIPISAPISSYYVENLDNEKLYSFKIESFTSNRATLGSDSLTIIYGVIASTKSDLPTEIDIQKIEFSPTNNNLLISSSHSSASDILLWNTDTETIIKKINFINSSATYTNDGKYIGITNNNISSIGLNSQIYIYNLESSIISDSIAKSGDMLDFNNMGTQVVISSKNISDNNFIYLYDMISHTFIWQLENTAKRKAKFNFNSTKIFCIEEVSKKSKIAILDPANGNEIGNIEPTAWQITDYELDRNNNIILSIASISGFEIGKEIEVWNLGTFQFTTRFYPFRGGSIYSFDLLNDGKILAVGKRYLQFYRTSDFRLVGELNSTSNINKILSIDFNYNGMYVAISQESTPVKIISLNYKWDYYHE